MPNKKFRVTISFHSTATMTVIAEDDDAAYEAAVDAISKKLKPTLGDSFEVDPFDAEVLEVEDEEK